MDGPSKKVVRKLRMEARSAARPSQCWNYHRLIAEEHAHGQGSKDVGGVGGGVEITSLEIPSLVWQVAETRLTYFFRELRGR